MHFCNLCCISIKAVDRGRIHRCSSSLTVPTQRGETNVANLPVMTSSLMDSHQHRLRACSDSYEIDDEEEDEEDLHICGGDKNDLPCRLIRQLGMIRRSCGPRTRRLTEGSISPTVFLTTPSATPKLLCASNLLHQHRHSTDCSLNVVPTSTIPDSQPLPLTLISRQSSNSLLSKSPSHG